MNIELARDGLTGNGLDKAYSDQGCFGIVVYYPLDRSKVIKIFKKGVRAREIFESEVGAYAKAMECSEISRLVASFRGTCRITSIVDEQGIDVSSTYELDCAYAMEYYPRAFEKLRDFADRSDSNSKLVSKLAGKFAKNRLSISDSSYCFKDNGCIVLIDFHLCDSTP